MKTRRQTNPQAPATEGHLLSRPTPPSMPAPQGLQTVDLGLARAGLIYVPPGYQADRPAPLAVMLHGAGGVAQHGMGLLREYADATGMILFAPASQRQTWDVIVREYGPDVEALDQALTWIFARCAIDLAHIAIGGFSDGASYALSLGITNGGLFTHVIAFSPGFMVPTAQEDSPKIYISHGTRDEVLPIDPCSRRIVPKLQHAGYTVRYREFDGPHTVPAEISREAVDWFLGA